MDHKNRANTFAAPVLAELEKLTDRLTNEFEVNEKMKNYQVKLEEQMKIEVAKVMSLEAENRTLKENLATKEEVIKVLTDGQNRSVVPVILTHYYYFFNE